MLIIIVPIGIKSEPDDDFESLGIQKVDFCVLGTKLIFQWKIGNLLKLKIFVPICQFFIILEIGHHFLFIFE